jgi:hypothetical protein
MSIGKWGRRGRANVEAAAHRGLFNERELFYRDLSEVHLLIDFVSGRPDKSLTALKDIVDFDTGGKKVESMSPQQVIEEVCTISYPPQGSLENTAQQAAFMLIVKDRLNYLAAPARGLTVAFTSMFAGVALDLHFDFVAGVWAAVRRCIRWLRGKPPPISELRNAVGVRRREFYSAQAAYPNLEHQARRFRNFYNFLPPVAVLLVAFIVYVNWDVSVTNAVLDRVGEARCDYAAALGRPVAGSCITADGKSVATDECSTPKLCAQAIASDRQVLNDLLGPGRWGHPIAFTFRIFGIVNDADTTIQPTDDLAQPTEMEIFARAVINGLNNIIIPTAFGLLGTLAGLMRSINAKVRGSVLAPRDYMVALIGLCLGVTAGLAVGLFFNEQQGAQALGKTITINAAGLSFLAGFGAEAFFTFLDGLLVRLLPAPSTPPPPPW